MTIGTYIHYVVPPELIFSDDKFLIHGPRGVGKSSLIDVLINTVLQLFCISTPVATQPIHLTPIRDVSTSRFIADWERVNYDCWSRIIAHTSSQLYHMGRGVGGEGERGGGERGGGERGEEGERGGESESVTDSIEATQLPAALAAFHRAAPKLASQFLLKLCKTFKKRDEPSQQHADDEEVQPEPSLATINARKWADAIRRCLSGKKEGRITVQVPLRWHALHQKLKQIMADLRKNVLTREQYRKAAESLGINDESCEEALKFFSGLNMLFYFPGILPHLVFLEPQVMLDKVAKLVEENCRMSQGKKGQQPSPKQGDWFKFRDYAQVTEKFLSEFEVHYEPRIFSPKEQIQLLKGFLPTLEDAPDNIQGLFAKLQHNLRDFVAELTHAPNIPLAQKCSILQDMARSLDYLHTRSPAIIHRDLTVRNVLLNSATVAKISDMDTAHFVNFKLGGLPRNLVIIKNRPMYEPKMDTFSFGHLTLITMLPAVGYTDKVRVLHIYTSTATGVDVVYICLHESYTTNHNFTYNVLF